MTGAGTVVYGVDGEFAKSKEGILSICQIIFGLLSWILMASLPYTKMIYTGGETGQFHCVMARMYTEKSITLIQLLSVFSEIENRFAR